MMADYAKRFQLMNRQLIAVLLVALAFVQSIACAQEITDATAVVTRVGQGVEFQDQVKAVSYSRSTEGYYLSFGAPYPKQVLSVWIPRKVYDRLPVHTSM